MGTHAFGFRPPANAPDGQKRFPISGALCSERGIDVCVIEYLRNSHFLNDPAVFAAALGQLIADADARAQLAAQAYACADRAFCPEACFGPLLAVIARS